MIETLCHLYFKSISVFIVLKFINTELSILMDELYFLVAKVQSNGVKVALVPNQLSLPL